MMPPRELLLLALAQASHIDDGDIALSAIAITSAAADGLGLDRCGVWMRASDGRSMRCIHIYDVRDGGHRAMPDLTIDDVTYPRYFSALARERAIVANDAVNHPDTAEFGPGYLTPLGIASMVDGPIRQHGRMVGILCAEHRGETRVWAPDEVAFLCSLADLFGRVLTAAERRDYQQRLESLNASLEQRVSERTHELSAALEYLEKTKVHLVESEKLAALGQLVAGVAHEINTPVGVIVTAVSHCSMRIAELRQALTAGTLTRSQFEGGLDDVGDGLAMALRNAERAAGLVESFKRTAADQTHDVRVRFKLGDSLADVVATLKPMLRRREVEAVLAPLPEIECESFPGSLAQVITNLVVNACVHGYGETPPPEAKIHIEAGADEREVWVRVRDEGRGMGPAEQAHAFEPFYTTARQTGGTGLGLAIVRTLVENTLMGEIHLHTAPGAGCTVELRFPRVAPPERPSPLAPAREAPQAGGSNK